MGSGAAGSQCFTVSESEVIMMVDLVCQFHHFWLDNMWVALKCDQDEVEEND